MRHTLTTLTLTLAVFAVSPGCGHPAPPEPVVRVEAREIPATSGAAAVDKASFDARGRLRWDGSPVSRPALCPPGAPETRRTTHRLDPRVDEVRCGRDALLAGIDAAGRVAWKRPLGFKSGELHFDERVVGSAPQGIVLNNLTVLSPRTGETISPPPTHPVGAERRPVPDHDLAQAVVYLPGRRAFLLFEADVTLTRREGGLYLLDPAAGRKDLLREVSTTLLGGHWRVEDMVPSEDGRLLFLAQKLAVRGPGGVSFAVFDLRERRLVFEERFGEDHFCRDPRIVPGPDGNVGFSYLDETAARRHLVHYRLRR